LLTDLIRYFIGILRKHSHVNWSIADQIVVSGGTFLTSVLIARYLGLKEFGIFSLAWAVMLFFSRLQAVLVTFPMQALAPKLAQKQARSYFGAALTLQLLVAIMSCLFVAIGTIIVGSILGLEPSISLAFSLSLAVFATQLQEYVRRMCFSCFLPHLAFLNDLVRYVVQFGLVLFVLNPESNAHAVGALWIVFFAAIIATVIGLPTLAWPELRKRRIRRVFVKHWRLSRWMLPSAGMQWVSDNAPLYITGSLLGPVSVGALKAAQNLLGVLNIPLQAAENIVPVRASQIFKNDGVATLEAYIWKVMRVTGLVTAFVVLGMGVVPDFWLNLVYGQEFAGYGFLVRWYACAYVLIVFVQPLRCGLLAIDRANHWFRAYAAMTFVLVICIYPAVHFAGLNGALGAYTFGLLILAIVTYKSFIVELSRM